MFGIPGLVPRGSSSMSHIDRDDSSPRYKSWYIPDPVRRYQSLWGSSRNYYREEVVMGTRMVWIVFSRLSGGNLCIKCIDLLLTVREVNDP